ncbi:MAG: hypothetical protein ACR2G7_01295, partial [Acidimicrobiales bacterium]
MSVQGEGRPALPVDRGTTQLVAETPTRRRRTVFDSRGGLDPSVAVRWMNEEQGLGVIAVAVDVG